MYKLRFMFDFGSGVCLWSANEDSLNRFGDYPVATELLPVSQEMKEKLNHLIDWYDEALNWDNPGGDLLWSESQIREFNSAAKKTYLALCDMLGSLYEIEFVTYK